jgi:hypothetical protein
MPTVRIYANEKQFNVSNLSSSESLPGSYVSYGGNQNMYYVDGAGANTKSEYYIGFDLTPLHGKKINSYSSGVYVNQYDGGPGSGFYFRAQNLLSDWGLNSGQPSYGTTLSTSANTGWIMFGSWAFAGEIYGIKFFPYVANAEDGQKYLMALVGMGPPPYANRPYLDVIVEYVTPYVSNPNPASGFVLKTANKTFNWGIASDEAYGPLTQQAAKFRWRPHGTEEYTEIDIMDGTMSYTVPANTFVTDFIEWQVQVQSTDGVWSSETEWHTLTTIDSLSTAVPISPVSTFAAVDADQTFTWQHIIDTGTDPTGADLQYQISNGAWTSLAAVLGSPETNVIVPANTLPAGNILWRVRTYNSDGIAGGWSDSAAFVGKGAPLAPSISAVTNSARPKISWQSLGQIAYQIQVVKSDIVYDTGETAGTAKYHWVTDYLEDGAYTARVRIKNSDLIWSNWEALAFNIATVKPTAPILSVSPIANGARIIATADATVLKMYLLRNGAPISKITNAFADYSALGMTKYVVRAVGADDSFIDSEPVYVDVAVLSAAIATGDNLGEIIELNQKQSGANAVDESTELLGSSRHYAGRKYPLYTFSEFTDSAFTLAYFYTDLANWTKLCNLIDRRQTVLYRDVLGNKYYGVITSIRHTQENAMYIFNLSVTRVDYVENIDYDAPGV